MPRSSPFAKLALVLLLSGCGSSALSPYAGDFGDDDSFVAQRKPDAGALLPANPNAPPPITSVSPVTAPSPGALPTPTTAPPLPIPPPTTVAPPMAARPMPSPWLRPERDLPSCEVHNLAEDCPPLMRVVGNFELPCDLSQVGQRCAYPSDDSGANLLECALSARGAVWQRGHARCSRNCWEEMPHPFAELDDSNCEERTLVSCEAAATNQDAIDSELKRIAAECDLPAGMVLGILVSSQGCGRALFIEDTGGLAKCAANAIARRRFSCGLRCASSKELGDSILQ